MAQTSESADSRRSDFPAANTPVQWSSPSSAPTPGAEEENERKSASAISFSDLAGRSAPAGSTSEETSDEKSDEKSDHDGEVGRDAAASVRFSS